MVRTRRDSSLTTHKKYRGSRSGPTLSLFFLLLILIPSFVAALDSQESLFTATPIPFWQTSGSANVEFDTDGYVNISSVAGSWLTGWTYRKSHTMIGAANANSNYQIKVNVTRSTGTDSGEKVFVGTKCQTDFDDIRFTDNDGITLLDYWRETYSANYAIFWIEVKDSLTSNAIIYIYYGNAGVSTTSSGTNTFIFFDDFESYPFTSWTHVGSYWTISTQHKMGSFAAYGDSGAVTANRQLNKSLANINYGIMIHSWARYQSLSAGVSYTHFISLKGALGYLVAKTLNDVGTYASATWYYYELNTIAIDTWYEIETAWDKGNNSFKFRRDGGSWGTEYPAKWDNGTTVTNFNIVSSWVSDTANRDNWMDDYYIRKYVDAEPSHSTWGSESTYSLIVCDAEIKIPVPKNKDLSFDIAYDFNQTFNAVQNATSVISLLKGTTTFGNLTLELDTLIASTASQSGTFAPTSHIKIEVKYSLGQLRFITYAARYDTTLKAFSAPMNTKNFEYFVFAVDGLIGSCQIVALKGDINYMPIQTSALTVSPYGSHSFGHDYIEAGAVSVTQKCNQTMFVPAFQFIRSEMLLDVSITGLGAGDTIEFTQALSIDFFYINGTKLLTMYGYFHIHDTNNGDTLIQVWGEIGCKFSNGTYAYYSNIYIPILDIGDVDIRLNGKLAIWRTQENHIGLGYFSVPYWNDWPSTYEGNLSTYITDFEIENYQANMTWYSNIATTGLNTQVIEIIFSANEYSYSNLAGVSQPHFSTNWWDSIPIVGWIINGFLFVAGIIINGLAIAFGAIISGLSIILGPIISAVGAIIVAALSGLSAILSGILGAILTAVGALAGAVWALFTGAIDLIIAGITGLAVAIGDYISVVIVPALVAGLLTLVTALIGLVIWIVDALGALFGITDLSGTLINLGIAFVSAAQSAIRMAGIVINTIVTVLASILDFLSTYGLMFLGIAGLIFVFDFVSAFLTTMKQGEVSYLEDFASRWGGALKKIFDIMWSVVGTVINFIGGIIP